MGRGLHRALLILLVALCVGAGPVASAGVDGVALDDRPERARKALAEGRCADAEADAAALTADNPELALGWRLAGDAARCHGATMEALRAYRRYEALGGSDVRVLAVLESLSESLGRVRIDQRASKPTSPLVAWVEVDEEWSPASSEPDGSLVVRDLPVGVALRVRIAGLGMRTETREVQPLLSGEVRRVELTPTFVGTAALMITGAVPDGTSLVFFCDHGDRPAASGDTVDVTAGPLVAQVSNDRGTTSVELHLAAGEVRDFDPAAHLPADLTVVGLPAGSQVRVFVESRSGGDVIRTYDVPDEGEIDRVAGLRVAPPQHFGSLQGGSGGLFVTHPVLGGGASTVALVGGETNAATFDWAAMDGLPGVRARYEGWQAEVTSARLESRRTVALGVLAGGVLVGGGALMAAGAGGHARAARMKRDATLGRADWTYDEQEAVNDAGSALVAAGGVTLGVGVLGVGFTVVSDLSVRRSVWLVGPWDPDGQD